LQAIYVLPEYQGRGVGKALWNEIRKNFDPKRKTIVNVAIYNIKAISFYEKLGFKDTGKRWQDETFKMKSGSRIPEMEMELNDKI
jgi:ribosomal protein S18 acetylase RimI-like enzyme